VGYRDGDFKAFSLKDTPKPPYFQVRNQYKKHGMKRKFKQSINAVFICCRKLT
jgi:hypothetical protein